MSTMNLFTELEPDEYVFFQRYPMPSLFSFSLPTVLSPETVSANQSIALPAPQTHIPAQV